MDSHMFQGPETNKQVEHKLVSFPRCGLWCVDYR